MALAQLQAHVHMDSFEELYVVGFRSPLAMIRHDAHARYQYITEPLPEMASFDPRCMISSCRNKSLTACPSCGLAFVCRAHGSSSGTHNHPDQQCRTLIEAKKELTAWTQRFVDLFEKHPDTTVFDRPFLRQGKLQDKQVQEGPSDSTASGASAFYQSPRERRDAQLRAHANNCHCDDCTIIEDKTINPHQHCLDGYCEAYRKVEYALFDIARDAKSGVAIKEILRMDAQAYRHGMSGDASPVVLLWMLSTGDPNYNHFCWNVMLSQPFLSLPNTHKNTTQRIRWDMFHQVTAARTLSRDAWCSPNGAHNEVYGFLNPVDRGNVLRNLESETQKPSIEFIEVLEPRMRVMYPTMELTDVSAEVLLVFAFQTLEDLRAVKNVENLKSRLPPELVLHVKESIVADSPVIACDELLCWAISRGEDVVPYVKALQGRLLTIYTHIDDWNRVVVKGSDDNYYYPWMPRFSDVFCTWTKVPFQRLRVLDQVLARMPRLMAWIRVINKKMFPRLMSVLGSTKFPIEECDPRLLYFAADQDLVDRDEYLEDNTELTNLYRYLNPHRDMEEPDFLSDLNDLNLNSDDADVTHNRMAHRPVAFHEHSNINSPEDKHRREVLQVAETIFKERLSKEDIAVFEEAREEVRRDRR